MKSALEAIAKALRSAEADARNLPNQNLADIIGMGAARIEQAAQHPDADPKPEVVDHAQEGIPANVDAGGGASGGEPVNAMPPNPFDVTGAAPATTAPGA